VLKTVVFGSDSVMLSAACSGYNVLYRGEMSVASDILIQVINLDRSIDRLASMACQLNTLGLVWERLPAVAPTQDQALHHPRYNHNRAKALFNRDLSPAEIGCFLSHIAALERFVESKAPIGLVLEDDAVVVGSSVEGIETILGFLGQSFDGEWHCVNLASSYRKRRRRVACFNGYDLYRAYYFPILTAALLWSQSGAKAFLASIEDKGIFAPVDEQLRHFLTIRGVGLFVDPCLIGLAPVESTIRDAVRSFSTKRSWALSYIRHKAPLYLAAFIRRSMGG
jgi:glycosyl transferase family 25